MMRDVKPSTPQEPEGRKSRINLTTSVTSMDVNSKTGGLFTIGAGFSWQSGIFSASFVPISEKKSVQGFSHFKFIGAVKYFADFGAFAQVRPKFFD